MMLLNRYDMDNPQQREDLKNDIQWALANKDNPNVPNRKEVMELLDLTANPKLMNAIGLSQLGGFKTTVASWDDCFASWPVFKK